MSTYFVYDRDFELQDTYGSIDEIVDYYDHKASNDSSLYSIDRDRLVESIDKERILIPNELIVTTKPIEDGWVPFGMKSVYVKYSDVDTVIQYPSLEALRLSEPDRDWDKIISRHKSKWIVRVTERAIRFGWRNQDTIPLVNVYDRKTNRFLKTMPFKDVGVVRGKVCAGYYRENRIYVHQGTHREEECFPKPRFLVKDSKGTILDRHYRANELRDNWPITLNCSNLLSRRDFKFKFDGEIFTISRVR